MHGSIRTWISDSETGLSLPESNPSTGSGTSGPESGSRRFLSARLSPQRAAALVRRPCERKPAGLDVASPFSVTLWLPERR